MAWLTRNKNPDADYSDYCLYFAKPRKGLRRISVNGEEIEWVGADYTFAPAVFHRLFRQPRLKPGAGPVEIKMLPLK